MPANSHRDRLEQKIEQKIEQQLEQKLSAANDKINEKINHKINHKINKGIDATNRRATKVAAQAAKHIESLDRLAAHLEVLDVWTRSEPPGRRPRFSRDEIAAAAIRIADAEGFEAVSMRRIAADLGAGTMTLYHYVRTKDELLTLVMDSLLAELLVPADEMPDGWREAMTAIAKRSRAVLQRHPWVLDINDDPNLGPNSVRHFDQSLQAVAGLHGSLQDKLDVMTVVDEYVFGYCLHQRTNFHDEADAGTPPELLRYVDELATNGEYPHIRAMMDSYGADGAWAQFTADAAAPDRFERNLARILDGFEAAFRGGTGA